MLQSDVYTPFMWDHDKHAMIKSCRPALMPLTFGKMHMGVFIKQGQKYQETSLKCTSRHLMAR